MTENRDGMLTAPPWRLVVAQGLPLALGMAGHALFNVVDLLLVGRLGPAAVAGVHVATTINFLPMIAGNAVSVVTLAVMAQRLGSGDRSGAATISNWSQWAMVAFGLLAGGLFALVAGPAVDVQGVTGPARAYGVEYLVVVSLGTFTMFGLMQATASMRAAGEALAPAVLLVLANGLNLVLDIVLLFGIDAIQWAGMGPVGAAWASTIARLVAMACGWIWLARRSHPLRFRWGLAARPRGLGRQVLRLGVPNAVQMVVRASTVVVLTRVAAELGGEAAVAALGVTTRLDTVVLFAAIGFASAATSVVGRNLGGGEVARARRAAGVAGLTAAAFALLCVVWLAAQARWLLGWFIADHAPDVISVGVSYLQLAAFAHPFLAFQVAATGALNGAGRMLGPMVLDVAGYGVLGALAFATLWARPAPVRLADVWAAYVAVSAALALAYALVLRARGWSAPATLTH